MPGLLGGAALGRLPLVDLVPLVGLPAFWIGAFLVFLARVALFGMPRSSRIDKVPRSPYLPRLFMEFAYWMFILPIRICVRLGVSANALTAGSLVVTVAASLAFGAGHFALGGWLLFFGFALDAWDGIVARQTGTASIAGEFIDATIDRYNDLFVFLGLMFYYRNDFLPLAFASAALVGSTLVSYTRAKGEAVGVDPNVGYMQRHERAFYLGAGTVLAPIVAAFVEPLAFSTGNGHPRYHLTMVMLGIVALAANVTAIWRARYVLARLPRPRQPNAAAPVAASAPVDDDHPLEATP
jgi:CDP-diacylglycerol--glycerol-3-phosphate 3-phosphatidyltransferase